MDDFLFDEFICLDALKTRLLYERFKELTEDMDSLLTDRPNVNTMTYEEAVKRIRKTKAQADCKDHKWDFVQCEKCKYNPKLPKLYADNDPVDHYYWCRDFVEKLEGKGYCPFGEEIMKI